MFIPYLRLACFSFILICFSTASFAEVYKWVDDNGKTHYSEQAPAGKKTKVIKPPPPPAVDPAVAQHEVDVMIEKQQGIYEDNEEQRQIATDEKNKKKELKEYCRVTRHNLKMYQDNPGRRMRMADGTVVGPNEDHRQQQIANLQADLKKHCS